MLRSTSRSHRCPLYMLEGGPYNEHQKPNMNHNLNQYRNSSPNPKLKSQLQRQQPLKPHISLRPAVFPTLPSRRSLNHERQRALSKVQNSASCIYKAFQVLFVNMPSLSISIHSYFMGKKHTIMSKFNISTICGA